MNPWYDRFTRMKTYFDQSIPNDEIKREMPGAMDSTTRFDAVKTREILTRKGFKETAIRRFCYRPFDHWLYWESDTKLLDEKRSEYIPHIVPGNLWIDARQKQPMDAFDHGYVTNSLADNFGNGLSNFFPLLLHKPFLWEIAEALM